MVQAKKIKRFALELGDPRYPSQYSCEVPVLLYDYKRNRTYARTARGRNISEDGQLEIKWMGKVVSLKVLAALTF